MSVNIWLVEDFNKVIDFEDLSKLYAERVSDCFGRTRENEVEEFQ